MPIAGAKLVAVNLKYGVICVDSYEDKVLNGRLWHSHFQEAKRFKSLMQLLLMMEATLGELEFPGAYTSPRSFKDSPPISEREMMDVAQAERALPDGKLGTFRVKIIFRQNASWQGSVIWNEGGREQSFRSALELMLLLDSALSA